MNLSAKLEKFNKDLGVRAVTTAETLDLLPDVVEGSGIARQQPDGPARPRETVRRRPAHACGGTGDHHDRLTTHGTSPSPLPNHPVRSTES